MRKHIIYFLIVAVIGMVGCGKEESFELGSTPSDGSLQSELTGDCLPKSVNGTYEVNKALVPATNTITVTVNVASIGDYIINTDTVNGIYFRATGIFTTPGANVVTLRGNGTPFSSLNSPYNFVVAYDSTYCDIQVDVLPAGAGGPAEYTIVSSGTPANCSGATAAGTYIIGTDLNNTNTVPISVNVTKIGTYTITTSTPTNGMTFTKTAAFLATGPATVTLIGSGKPTGTAGVITVPLVAGAPTTSTCNFVVNTVAGAVFTLDCATATASGVHGTYQAGVPLTGANTIDVNVTAITTPGPYFINTTVNGMNFTASGNLTTLPATITLSGTGTPINGGITSQLTVPSGTGTCSIDIPVAAGAVTGLDWEFTAGATFYKGTTTGATEASFGGNASVAITGPSTTPSTDYTFLLNLGKPGTFSTGTFTSNSMTNTVLFTIINTATTQTTYTGVFGNGANLTVIVTVYDQVNKVIQGTFSGTVKDAANATVTISGGKFKAQIM